MTSSSYQQELQVICETIESAIQFYDSALDQLDSDQDKNVLNQVKSVHLESLEKLSRVLKPQAKGTALSYNNTSYQMLADVRTSVVDVRKNYAQQFSIFKHDRGFIFIDQLEEVEDLILESLDKVLTKRGTVAEQNQAREVKNNAQETHDAMKDLQEKKRDFLSSGD